MGQGEQTHTQLYVLRVEASATDVERCTYTLRAAVRALHVECCGDVGIAPETRNK